MAIHQWVLITIPEARLMEKYGKIPDHLDVVSENEYDNALFIEWWRGTNTEKVIGSIERIAPKSEYEGHWGNSLSHDIGVVMDDKRNELTFMQVRVAVNETILEFLNQLIKFCVTHRAVLMDKEGIIIKPNMREIAVRMKGSSPYQYMIPDPQIEELLNKE